LQNSSGLPIASNLWLDLWLIVRADDVSLSIEIYGKRIRHPLRPSRGSTKLLEK
jgi:hypothetical protein